MIITDETRSFTVDGFAATGADQDRLDLSVLSDAETLFASEQDVLDQFTQTEIESESETIPVAIFMPTEITGLEVRFTNLLVSDLGPDNIILPGDAIA